MNKTTLIIIGILLIGFGYYAGSLSKTNTTQGSVTPPTPTISFDLQRQCGIDAREFIKQYSGSQILLESSYSSKLQSCIAYTEDSITVSTNYNPLTPQDKTLYNVTTNKTLGGYIYTAPTATHSYTSTYWISTPTNPGGQNISLDDFNKYILSLGLHINE